MTVTTTTTTTITTDSACTDTNTNSSTVKGKSETDMMMKPSLPITDTTVTSSISCSEPSSYRLLLDRLHHNAIIYPKKRAMAFVIPSSSSVSSSSSPYNVKIEREITYAELEYETDQLAISLLEEHQIKKGDRYVLIIIVDC